MLFFSSRRAPRSSARCPTPTPSNPPTQDGSHPVVVPDPDTAGNTANASITFTLDKTIATPTVALSNDSGSSNSDLITNDASLTFSAARLDVTPTYNHERAEPAASYIVPRLDGSHNVVVTDTDTAGNTAHARITFTLD